MTRGKTKKVRQLIKLPLDVDAWLEVSKPLHLVKADVENLEVGESITCLCLDRNVHDTITTPYNRVVAPSTFFRNVMFCTFTRLNPSNLVCRASFSWMENGKRIQNAMIREDFEFDVNYRREVWYPMTQGKIKIEKNEKQMFPPPIKGLEDITKYPPSVRLGVRGPMIPLHMIDDMPDIFHFDAYAVDDAIEVLKEKHM